jgi:hypothetical protein
LAISVQLKTNQLPDYATAMAVNVTDKLAKPASHLGTSADQFNLMRRPRLAGYSPHRSATSLIVTIH